MKYGEKRLSTFLIKDISFAKLMHSTKQNCSPLAHLPASNIHPHPRYRDEDGDMINLSEDPDDFAFGEMLRSTKEVKDRDYGKIFLQESEVDSPLPRKVRQMDVEMLSSSASNEFESLQLKHLSFTPTPGAHLATTTAPKNAEKSPLDYQGQEMEENLKVLKVQIASAKEELEKLDSESRHFQSLSDIRARLCKNHCKK